MFGHEKGSFTGAIGESEGYFGIANKGTIFLDEVGELPIATQARLLRVLETGEYIRVGGQEIRKTDVRIVAATNVNMRKAISEGRFREDLYYRLNTIPIQMPPLRDRDNDIILLFRLFAMQMAEKYRIPKVTLTEDAKALLLHYKWPGNVRQLKNITEQISILSKERESEREILYKILYELRGNVSDLRRDMTSLRKKLDDAHELSNQIAYPQNQFIDNPAPQVPAINHQPSPVASIAQPSAIEAEAEEIRTEPESLNLNDLGRQMVEKALERNGGNRKKAAKELGISDRTLYRRIKQYGLDKK